MDFKFLGTGGAFDFEYGNSAAWVEFKDEKILLDCGYSVYNKLRRVGLADQITDIIITHMHDDHVGSLSTAILHHKHMVTPPRKARILYPPTDNGRRLRDRLKKYLSYSLLSPDDYVEFIPIEEGSGIGFFDTSGKHVKGLLSFGYYFENEEEVVVYSGDIGDPNLVFDVVDSFDHEKKVRIFHEVFFYQTNGVHTYYKDLVERLGKYEVYGYHNDPSMAPADNQVPLVSQHKEFLL